MLETTNLITLEDATETYDTFVDVVINTSDVQVDGSTSDSTAPLDKALQELWAVDDDNTKILVIVGSALISSTILVVGLILCKRKFK